MFLRIEKHITIKSSSPQKARPDALRCASGAAVLGVKQSKVPRKKVVLTLILMLLPAYANCDASAVEIATKIEVIFSKRGEDWLNVWNYPQKFVNFYRADREEYVEYIANKSPQRLDDVVGHGDDASTKMFLVFHNPSKNVYRAGWYYEWRTERKCTTAKWDYKFYGYTSSGSKPGLGEVASGGVSGSGSCPIP